MPSKMRFKVFGYCRILILKTLDTCIQNSSSLRNYRNRAKRYDAHGNIGKIEFINHHKHSASAKKQG